MRRAAVKILGLAAAAQAVATWRAHGRRVVLAHGSFDLLHVGHLRYLQAAKRQGDRLVVAVRGDEAMARLDGPAKPVLPAVERAALVAALRCVDGVVVFEEPTPDRVLEQLGPDVHARGQEASGHVAPAAHEVRTVITGDPSQHAIRDLAARVKARLEGDA